MSITPDQARYLAEQVLDEDEHSIAEERCLAPADSSVDVLPKSIGGYTIIREIASGGMGTVYEAQQTQPCRTVAIKVLKPGLTSRTALKRFEFESELLGSLKHSGIATVFEAGTHDDGSGGVPYFVMEYIPGARPITKYSEEKQLDIRQRLELFAEACDAVQYGHQKGIIHRDLKPGNILVGEETGTEASRHRGDKKDEASHEPCAMSHEGASLPGFKPSSLSSSPILKIIDFGIARSTDSDMAVTTMHTEVGQLIGTLQYMSPEQCEGNALELDMRSDVYSLGVVLYELICGQLPYDLSDTSIPHATRIIQESEPTRPSSIQRKLRGDLETIALKALEKDREKRYQSAAELAADVRRYLRGEPIEAKSSTVWAKCARWICQHPVTTTLSTCLMIATLSLSMTYASVWYLNSKPHRVILNDDGTEVSLISISGRILETWKSPEPGTFDEPILLDCPDEYGGGRLLLVAVSKSGLCKLGGGLNVFRLGESLSEPWWTGTLRVSEIPKVILDSGYRSEQFHTNFFKAFDIFSEYPGDELVVIGQHGPRSQCCIRIYSLAGRLLSQYWHDGNVQTVHWSEKERLLTLGGVNGEAYWEQRGVPDIGYAHPFVVYAISPALNYFDDDWLNNQPPSPQGTLRWYRCILPALSSDVFQSIAFTPPTAAESQIGMVRIHLTVRHFDDGTTSWLLDRTGSPVANTAYASDDYVRNSELPQLTTFSFGLLPPLISPSE